MRRLTLLEGILDLVLLDLQAERACDSGLRVKAFLVNKQSEAIWQPVTYVLSEDRLARGEDGAEGVEQDAANDHAGRADSV